jgi:hypothetical protein
MSITSTFKVNVDNGSTDTRAERFSRTIAERNREANKPVVEVVDAFVELRKADNAFQN